MTDTIEYMNLGDVADIIVGVPDEKPHSNEQFEYYCIQPSNLQEFNQVSNLDIVHRNTRLNETVLVKTGDILIKRLNPSNINILLGEFSNTYVSGNIMIIRVKEGFDAKYLASVLETQRLPSMQHDTKRGIIVQTISKSELQNVLIPILPINKQKALGEIWILSKQKQRILRTLAIEEEKYTKAIFDTFLNNEGR
jgi:Type I restriction modification DNA specificity domain.